MVLFISVTDALKSETVELCHLVIAPVFPLKVNAVLLVPVHTVALPAMVPPTDTGSIVTAIVAVTAEHPPKTGVVYVTVYVPDVLVLGVIAPVVPSIVKPVPEV